jgi:3-hydroxybutyryl-CoA dehydrogenase
MTPLQIGDVRRILIIGAGTMGGEIGFQCARHGYDVVLYDSVPEALEAVLPRLKAYVEQFMAEGYFTRAEIEAALAGMSTNEDPREAAEDVDLVSESIPEDPELKGEVFARFNELCPPHTVFTTNTSTLLPSQFAKATGREPQFAALHFHTPVWMANVVDVMSHPGTSEETVALLRDFAERIGQIPIVLEKEHGSYVFNAMLNAMLTEAQTMAADGVASVEDIDRAWMGVMQTSIGPFGIMDLVGLDTVWRITDYWAKKVLRPQLRRNADFVKEYIDKGYLGRKNGRGFYTYPNPAYEQPGFVQREQGTVE